jgi:hypothetical protein
MTPGHYTSESTSEKHMLVMLPSAAVTIGRLGRLHLVRLFNESGPRLYTRTSYTHPRNGYSR